jgi:DNA-binding NarL/FixJ family response regulator
MSFWWEDKSRKANRIPSLDTGTTNIEISVKNESIFKTEEFKNISSMFTEEELQVARFKADDHSAKEIASYMNLTEKEVTDMILTMKKIYFATYKNEQQQFTSSRSR